MKQFILKYVNDCEGWKTAIKQLHWNAKNLAQHKLCDEIADTISDFQDQVSEVEQSISGNLPFNKLKGTPYKVSSLEKFINDVIKTTNSFYDRLKKEGSDYVGMASDCESFLSEMQRKMYLAKFTIHEQRRRIVKLTESQLHNVIKEAVKKSLITLDSRKINKWS